MKGEEKLLEVMKAQCIHDSDRVGLQDIIGRATMKELKVFYAELDERGKRMFLWVVISVMGADTAMDVFEKVVAWTRVHEMMAHEQEELSLAWRRFSDETLIFDEGKRAVHRRLKEMRKKIESMQRNVQSRGKTIGRLGSRLDGAYREANHLRRQIKGLEDELEEYRIVKQAFEILSR